MNNLEVIDYLKTLKKRIDNYHTKVINETDPKEIKSILRIEKIHAEQIQKIYDVISLVNSFSEEELLTEQNNNVEKKYKTTFLEYIAETPNKKSTKP